MSTTAFTDMVHNLEVYVELAKNPKIRPGTPEDEMLWVNNVLEQIRLYEQSML